LQQINAHPVKNLIEKDPESNFKEVPKSMSQQKSSIPSFLGDKTVYTDYSVDIINTLFEDQRIPLKQIRTDQVDIRNKLVKTIKCFAKHHKFQVTTVHLAVVLLDLYLNDYILTDIADHQKFVAIVILLLAAKSEDLDEKIPSIKDILSMVDLTSELGVDLRMEMNYEEDEIKAAYKAYSDLYCKLEYLVFECAGFNTIRPTMVHFLQVFQNIVVSESDLGDLENDKRVIESISDMRLFANEYFRQFLNIVLENIEFNTVLPSHVAAGIIATTRQLLGIHSVWPLHLQNYLRCTYEEIDQIVKILLTFKAIEEATTVKVDEDNGWKNEECDSGCYVDASIEGDESKIERESSEEKDEAMDVSEEM
jgi:hypothetical protein